MTVALPLAYYGGYGRSGVLEEIGHYALRALVYLGIYHLFGHSSIVVIIVAVIVVGLVLHFGRRRSARFRSRQHYRP